MDGWWCVFKHRGWCVRPCSELCVCAIVRFTSTSPDGRTDGRTRHCLQQPTRYTPSANAEGDFFYPAALKNFRLSNAQVNAVIGTDDTDGHVYVHSCVGGLSFIHAMVAHGIG